MRPLALSLSMALVLSFSLFAVGLNPIHGNPPRFQDEAGNIEIPTSEAMPIPVPSNTAATEHPGSSRALVLVGSLTVFVLSIFIGFEIIAKVPPTLHTPLMSGSNAISGITVIGAIIASGYRETGVGTLIGLIAIVLAMINVVGGFLVTHRMLLMFKKR